MSAISGTGSSSLAAAGGISTMSPQDFLKVMLSELKNQDPLQPQDSSKLLDQFSSLQNIQSQLNLQQSISSLVLQNQISAAGGMLNKYVTGLDDSNATVSGTVTAVRVADSKVLLDLDNGKSLSMANVTQIATPPSGAGTATPAATGTTGTNTDNSLLSALAQLLNPQTPGTATSGSGLSPVAATPQ